MNEKTHLDKIHKDVTGLVIQTIKDYSYNNLWVYCIKDDSKAPDVFKNIQFVKADSEEKAFHEILSLNWDWFFKYHLYCNFDVFKDFVDKYLYVFGYDCEECDKWLRDYERYENGANDSYNLQLHKCNRRMVKCACKTHIYDSLKNYCRERYIYTDEMYIKLNVTFEFFFNHCYKNFFVDAKTQGIIKLKKVQIIKN